MFYIGIDGGGTKTKFILINESEEIVETVVKGTCHFNQVGFDGLEVILKEGLEELLAKAGVNHSEVKRACLGLAGYGKVQSIVESIEEKVAKVFNDIDYVLFNDVKIAHAGALAGNDGIMIISGTGSIGLSLNNGEYQRTGGWGHNIGDEGSAYWIGKKTIEYYSKAADGRLDKGILYEMLKEELVLKDDYDLILYINTTINARREEIAKLAKVVTKAAQKGDIYALKIFEEAGKELAAIINNLAKGISSDEVLASYIGGVFNAKELILNPIRKNLNKNINLIAPKYAPEMGACLIAKKSNSWRG